jgi:hypothetical protein
MKVDDEGRGFSARISADQGRKVWSGFQGFDSATDNELHFEQHLDLDMQSQHGRGKKDESEENENVHKRRVGMKPRR